MLSIRLKLVSALMLTCLLFSAIIYIATPHMVKHEMIEGELREKIISYQPEIEDYIQKNNTWGTPHSAKLFANSQKNPLKQPNEEKNTLEFALFDDNGNVIIPGAGFKIGDTTKLNDLNDVESFIVAQSTLIHAIAIGNLELSPRQLQSIHALEETLLFSMFAALAVILPLGFIGASRMANALQRLNKAVNRMAAGDLAQQVPVNSEDEVGQLSESFNSMNDQLVKAYNQLEESNTLIAAQAEEMKELSIRDELTGLYNRRYFNREASATQAEAIDVKAPFTLVLGDVDHFKNINDQYSHATGDIVLQKIAEILLREIRSSDLLARYGGEEIVLALPNTDLHEASDIINRIRERIENYPWQEINESLQVTMSFGIAHDYSDKKLEKQLDLADTELYRAKREGRNRVCCSTTQLAHAL